jgi:hypothetical protein
MDGVGIDGRSTATLAGRVEQAVNRPALDAAAAHGPPPATTAQR